MELKNELTNTRFDYVIDPDFDDFNPLFMWAAFLEIKVYVKKCLKIINVLYCSCLD